MDLEVGNTSRIRITFTSGRSENRMTAAAALAKASDTTWRCDRGAQTCLVGEGDQGVLKLFKELEFDGDLIQELRILERKFEGDQKELAAIFGALLSVEAGCAEGLMEIKGAPALFAHLAAASMCTMHREWSNNDLENHLNSCLNELAEGKELCRPEAGALDSAQFWLNLAQRLWQKRIRARLSPVHHRGTTRKTLMMLAGSWVELCPEANVMVRRSRFHLKGLTRRYAWPQIMEWEAGAIRKNVLQYLTAYHRDYKFDGLLINMLGLDGREREMIPSRVAAAVSRSLLEEVTLQRVIDPCGSFRVDLPGHTPLKEWGVTSMRVWIIPQEGFWVALERDDQPGASLLWSIHPPHVRRWILHDHAVPALHLTLSALWRDLKIGGREAILAFEETGRHSGKGEASKLRLYGRIQWGTEEELERILREAYPVEDHIRVLPAGKIASRRAYKQALSRGIMLKPGTTYVRKHKRGKPEQTEKNVPYKAQGLAKLILASRSSNRVQNTLHTR